MYKVTLETPRGNFTIEQEYAGFKVGQKVFIQSPYYKKRGTYKIIKIEQISRRA